MRKRAIEIEIEIEFNLIRSLDVWSIVFFMILFFHLDLLAGMLFFLILANIVRVFVAIVVV